MKKIFLMMTILLFLSSCGQGDTGESNEELEKEEAPFYKGMISDMMESDTEQLTVSGEVVQSSDVDYDSLIVWIEEDTQIKNTMGDDIAYEALSTGEYVSIWLKDDIVMESMPPQVKASKIVVGTEETTGSSLNEEEIIQEQKEGDFVFRAVSEKKTYNPHEPVHIAGMIRYGGKKESVEVGHGGFQLMRFKVEEKTRDITIDWAHASIFSQTTLTNDEWHIETFEKTGEIGETEFHEEFFNKEGLPEGQYVITISTDLQIDEETTISFSEDIEIEVKEEEE
ncbi:hypothetical protein [Alteribacillus iranensis]|uniref:hypothetical protein n=1 Tax=Alteribacillus iranensis TaxID=930128 RepID=UPI000B820530|nr:hypothetical protein [Alteribacillus iranensis]